MYRNDINLLKVGELLGATPEVARRVAESIFEVEKKIANITEPPEKHRDVTKLYHSMTLDELTNLAPFVSTKTISVNPNT